MVMDNFVDLKMVHWSSFSTNYLAIMTASFGETLEKFLDYGSLEKSKSPSLRSISRLI